MNRLKILLLNLNSHLTPPPDSLQPLRLPLHLGFLRRSQRQVGPTRPYFRHVDDLRLARARLRQARALGLVIYLGL